MAGHIAKNYEQLLGKLHGISDVTLKAHFTLYQGYVKKLNEIWEKLPKADRSLANYSFGEYSELRRRESVPYNGTYLHELYFDNLGPNSTQAAPELKKAVESSFGSFDAWVNDFKACGASAHGWAMLTWDPHNKRVTNDLVYTEHQAGLFVGNLPLLVMDVWEHAYYADYQTKKADYVAAFLNNVSWKAVNDRWTQSQTFKGE